MARLPLTELEALTGEPLRLEPGAISPSPKDVLFAEPYIGEEEIGAVVECMRSGWLSMAIVLVTCAVLMLQRENRVLRRTMLTVPALAVLILALSYLASPLFQQRLHLTRAAVQGTTEAIDQASSDRIPIFVTAWRMYRNHPVNGVGVRAFRYAYPDYAAAGDPWVDPATRQGAAHAHHWMLEVVSETGVLGLLCWLLGIGVALRAWRKSDSPSRALASAPGVALVSVLFPLNTHYAVYSSFWALLLFSLLALWLAGIGARQDATSK